jgi:hypothetical protein
MMLDEMHPVQHAGSIDITTWTWFDDDDSWRDIFAAGFAVQINKILRKEFRKHPPTIDLPFMWRDGDGLGGKCPDDPAMLYVCLPLGADVDSSPYWAISLESVVDDFIDGIVSRDTLKIEGDEKETAHLLAARLRELAQKLDDACAVVDRNGVKVDKP